MDGRELRLGNIISFKGMWSGEVEAIHEHSIDIKGNKGFFDLSIKDPYSIIIGVPLTPETLNKFGFTKHSESEYYINYELPNKINISMAKIDTGYDKAGSYYIGDSHIEIKSLHWLQNWLYFTHNIELTCHT